MKKGMYAVEDFARANKALNGKGKTAGKTHHQTGYHKRIKNPSTNYIGDPHKTFCKRCMAHNKRCPLGSRNMGACSL